jgi:cellobiose-specific phosphotransferase system component IIA
MNNSQERWVIYKPSHTSACFKVVHEKSNPIISRPQHESFDGYTGVTITRDSFEIHNKQLTTKTDRKQHLKEYLKTEREKAELSLNESKMTFKSAHDAWPPVDKIKKRVKLLRKSRKTLDPEHLTFDPVKQTKMHKSYYSALRTRRQNTIEKFVANKVQNEDEKINACTVTSEQILSKIKGKQLT